MLDGQPAMNKLILFLSLTLPWLGFATAARADIAPTHYTGYGITPVGAPGIRMVSAKVDIQWGEPGTLAAVFVMRNEDARPTDVQLGFPVALPEEFHHKDRLDFTMTFDGVPLDRADIRQGPALAEDHYSSPADIAWFYCRYRFPPGATTVRVASRLPAIAAYHSPYHEDLNYCVQTGAAWKGRIGSEEIAIHFPAPLGPGQIEICKPASGVVDGDTVRWKFENFEPKKGDHDIWLRFLQPDVPPILADLRWRADADPGDPGKQLDLIKHLLALSFDRRTFPLPPDQMPPDEYREILALFRSDADRARFQALYGRERALYRGKWHGPTRRNPDPERDMNELVTLLNNVGYVPRAGRSAFLTEGRARLARLLREHPHDADAWNLLLLHSTGFEGRLNVYPFLQAQIRQALANCPDDSSIRLWADTCQLELARPADETNFPTPDERRMFDEEDRLLKMLEQRGLIGESAFRFSHRIDEY